jgi:hypothetical protein
MKRFQITAFSILVLLVVGLLLGGSVNTRAGGDVAAVSLGIDASERLVIRLYYQSQAELDAVAGSLDIWEVHRNEGYVLAAVTPSERDWLAVSGYRVETDAEHTAILHSPTAALDPRYYYFDSNYNNSLGRYIIGDGINAGFLDSIAAAYPDLTELIDIGNAWQGNNGYHLRDMWVLRITNEDPAYGDPLDKPAFFLMAEIHAREVATPELAIRYIAYLTSGFDGQGGYGLDPDVTWMVNHHVIYVLVMQNPDGHVPNEADTSAYRRKNMNNLDGCTDPYSWGVDLNRNHSFLWGCCGGSSGSPCSETYRGNAEASEPETYAFQDFIQTVIPDVNGPNDNWTIGDTSPITTTGFFISLHSYSDEILWPWYLPGYPPAPNQDQMEDIGRKMADIDPFYEPTGTIGYTVDGSANYWTYGILGIPAFTFEVGPAYGSCGDFFPAYGCIDGIDGMPRDFWAENRPVFIYATKIARQPYLVAYGPDTENVAVDPPMAIPGEPVALTATVLDNRYSSDPLQPVLGAEYFIDAPGVDGTGIPMSPSDGAWGETNEPVEAVVDTTGLTPGQHYILVHGRNNNGIWGPFTAVFLNIEEPGYALQLSPGSAQGSALPGTTVDYTFSLANLGSFSDTYTVTITSTWQTVAPAVIGPVAPGDSISLPVSVAIPSDAPNGMVDIATLQVTSQGDPLKFAEAVITTTSVWLVSFLPLTVK